jgi:LEA14-like dessication related protein
MRRLAALLLIAALGACAGGTIDQPPEVSLVNIRPLSAGLFEQRMAVTLRITNPNDADLPVDGYRFAVEVNGQPFAKGTSRESLTVPRLGDATTEAEATIATSDLMRQVLRVPAAGGLAYTLTGTVFLDTATGQRSFPFTQGGSFDFLESAFPRQAP